jgi:hypothetical protein
MNMKKLLTLLALLTLCVLPLQAQQVGFTQSFIDTVALAPPTVTAGQNFSTTLATGASTSLTGGAVAAGTYRICVTFFSLANTETPCSVDTAATSVITTTGTTSTVTVFPPVAAQGIGSIIGWRVYIGASAGAAAAETLQTINATVCTLSASSTPSCSLNSAATFTASTNFVGGSGGPATPGTLLTYPNSNAANMALFENAAYPTAILSWTLTGTAPSACTVQLQTGATVAALANVGQAITCTATGSYALPSAARPIFIAPNITAFTAGDTTTSMLFSITVLPYPLVNYWGPATPTSACTALTGLFTVQGTTTSTLFTCAAGTWTAVTLP